MCLDFVHKVQRHVFAHVELTTSKVHLSPPLYKKIILSKCLDGSVGGACDSSSWDFEFKAHVGCRDSLKKSILSAEFLRLCCPTEI